MAKKSRDIRKLYPAGATFLGLIVLIIVARFYDQLPIQGPGCGFRRIVGIPCLGCGGTRSMMAMAHGKFLTSFLFNPAIFLGVIWIVAWFVKSLVHFWRNTSPPLPTKSQRQRFRFFLSVGLPILLLLNWIYLAIYLPEA